MTSQWTVSPDYDTVPAGFGFESKVCRCGHRDSFTSPVNWLENDERHDRYPLQFDWWVCSHCLAPAPLNALNARLIRECEMCEDPYFINHFPDRMNLCEACA